MQFESGRKWHVSIFARISFVICRRRISELYTYVYLILHYRRGNVKHELRITHSGSVHICMKKKRCFACYSINFHLYSVSFDLANLIGFDCIRSNLLFNSM